VALTEIPKNDRSDEQGYLERHYEAVYLRRREINERHHERSLDSALVAASAATMSRLPKRPRQSLSLSLFRSATARFETSPKSSPRSDATDAADDPDDIADRSTYLRNASAPLRRRP
jgi:hypothetical protein